LIPDIKGDAHIVLESGNFYPHHNLYFVLSKEWPLAALQALLMAGIAHLFVRAYSTKMHGGALRFQAQYLRRIRLPKWSAIDAKARTQLLSAIEANDSKAILKATALVYRMTPDEAKHLNPAT
jgi:hypothetical protein